MATLCIPTIITGALFVAIIFNDILQREFEDLPGHSMIGVVSVLLMAGLCQRGAILVAWGLLLLPITVLLIIVSVQLSKSTTSSATPGSNEYPANTETNKYPGYRGAFMFLDYDWGKGTTTSGSGGLPR